MALPNIILTTQPSVNYSILQLYELIKPMVVFNGYMIPGKQAVKPLLIDSSTWASRSLSTIVIQRDAVNADSWEAILLNSNERKDCSIPSFQKRRVRTVKLAVMEDPYELLYTIVL